MLRYRVTAPMVEIVNPGTANGWARLALYTNCLVPTDVRASAILHLVDMGMIEVQDPADKSGAVTTAGYRALVPSLIVEPVPGVYRTVQRGRVLPADTPSRTITTLLAGGAIEPVLATAL
jgi:hypothetical protein